MLKEIIEKCKVLIKFFQDTLIAKLDERQNTLSLEMLCACCNNCQNSFGHIDDLQGRIDDILGEDVIDLSDSKDGFTEAATRCVSFIANAAMPFTNDFFVKLFREEWYSPGEDGPLAAGICETFKNVFEDINAWVEDNWFVKVVFKVLEKAANKYVEMLLDKKLSAKIEFKRSFQKKKKKYFKT